MSSSMEWPSIIKEISDMSLNRLLYDFNYTCCQNRYDSIEIPIVINQGQEFIPGSSDALKELPKILMQEECDMHQMTERWILPLTCLVSLRNTGGPLPSKASFWGLYWLLRLASKSWMFMVGLYIKPRQRWNKISRIARTIATMRWSITPHDMMPSQPSLVRVNSRYCAACAFVWDFCPSCHYDNSWMD